jgi:hypothetical protein
MATSLKVIPVNTQMGDYVRKDVIEPIGTCDYWLKLQKRGKSELELQISVNFFSVIENILQ